MIKFFNSNNSDFSKNGEFVAQPLKAIETKKKSLNGWYIEFEFPIEYAEKIKQDMICFVKTKSKTNPQMFRVSNIEKLNRVIKFNAYHIYYDAEGYFLTDVRSTNHNGQNTLSYLNDRVDQESPFTVFSNVETVSTAYFIRKNLLEAWEVVEERWNGTFDFDNYNVSFLNNIGQDRGQKLYYSKNIQGIKICEDWSNVVTRIYGTGKDGIMIDSEYIDSDIKYHKPYTRTIPFETELDEENQTEDNLKTELKQKMIQYLNENKYPKISYEITSDINQDLEIGDIITVLHPLVEIRTEVQEYQYNLLTKRVIKLVFGNYSRDVKSRFDNIKKSISKVIEKVSTQDKTIADQTNLINRLNKFGHLIIEDNELMIVDTIPKENAKEVMRIGLGGIGFSHTGIEGPFVNAWTIDGQLNADFITSGKMSTSRIEGLDELLLSVNKKFNFLRETEGLNEMKLDDSLEYQPISFSLKGKSTKPIYFYPSENLYPGNNVYPIGIIEGSCE